MLATFSIAFLLAFTPSADAANAPSARSWCSTPNPPQNQNEARERTDIEIHFVARIALESAMRRLSTHTMIPLDIASYRAIANDGRQPTSGKYLYLVRAGVMTPVEVSDQDFPAYAEQASYYFSQNPDTNMLNIVSIMTSEIRQYERNYALLISSETPVEQVAVGCIGGR